MRKCKFLSSPIYVDENDLLPYIDMQNAKFLENFVKNTTYFNGLPIKVIHYNDQLNYGNLLNKGEYRNTSFAHIVSKQPNKNLKNRDIDVQRLRTCHWVKELIDIYNDIQLHRCNMCQGFYSKDLIENGRSVSYIFCSVVRYVIILEKHQDAYRQEFYIIKTAFYVNEESMYRGLMKKLV